ncbi:MAG: hypothetical protein AB1403_03435 [Candidatus Riflebacteria bacterium]
MGLIAKTLTKGFRTSYFRNQPVHQFYGHLQAVLKDIDGSGQMNSLFARPASSAANEGEMEWSTELNGDPISFKDLSPEKQQEVAGVLSSSIEKIKNYADSKQGKTGIEKDYADYLKAVAMSPDLNQVFVINNRPVLVHWGFSCDSGNHPGQGIYAGWDEFIAQVQRKAAPKRAQAPKSQEKPDQAAAAAAVFAGPPPEAEPIIEKHEEKIVEKASDKPAEKKPESPAKEPPKPEEKKPVNKANDPNREKPVMALGLGIYKWVKWLAIVLAIIILLLLLLKFMLPRNPMGGMSGMPMGGGMPSLQDLLGGGMPGGGGGMPGGGGGMPAGGGAPGGSGGSGGSGQGQGQGQKGPHTCPHCGHSVDDSGSHGQAPAPEKKTPQSTQPSNPPQTGQAGN